MAAASLLSPFTILVALLLLFFPGAAAFLTPTSNSRPCVTGLDAVSRREILEVSTTAALVSCLPMDALANDGTTAQSFQGVFKDPAHPKGYRVIVGDVGKKVTMTLQDEPGGKVYSIPIKSKIDKSTNRVTLTIDFSVKGGPKAIVANLNDDSSISFPDGNRWKKEGGVSGVYSDGVNPKYRRIIRKEKGSDLVLDLINGSKKVTVSGKAGKSVTFDFPGKPGDKGSVDSKKGTISFADGNVWTKL